MLNQFIMSLQLNLTNKCNLIYRIFTVKYYLQYKFTLTLNYIHTFTIYVFTNPRKLDYSGY